MWLSPEDAGAVIYLCSLLSPPPPASAGNAFAAAPLVLILLTAMAFSLGRRDRAGPDVPGGPRGRLTQPGIAGAAVNAAAGRVTLVTLG